MQKPLPKAGELIQMVRGLLVMMDPGRDQDDEDVLVQLNRFIRIELLEVLGIVANLKPSRPRARLARGTLDVLGVSQVPVGFGSGHLERDSDDDLPYEFQVGYIAPEEAALHKGAELIHRTLEAAPKKGVVLTLISQLTDAAQIMREGPNLFREKVRRIVIMGGVESAEDGLFPKLDAEGRLLPDMTAQNHTFDREATQYVYRTAQDMGIPLTILSRHAAAAVKVPRAIYDDMAATGHPVGVRLCAAQREAIEHLWQRACAPNDAPERKGLPARCDKTWFSGAFLGGAGKDRATSDSIWDLVESFMLYDPCTLLAAMPGIREYFYDPYVHERDGVENFIIGMSAKRTGVARTAELTEYLHSTLVESLQLSLESIAA